METEGSEAVSEMMVEKTRKPPGGPGMTGGSIRRLVEQYEDIMKGHQAEVEEGGEDARQNFTQNILQATSNIMELAVGWQELPVSDGRFETTSQMLSSIDLLGFIYGSNGQVSKSCNELETNFESDNIKLAVFVDDDDDDDNDGKCFAAGDLGSICLPNTDNSIGCPVHVASQFQVQEENKAMFLVENTTDFLSDNLIGLTVNNAPFYTADTSGLVRITIKHHNVQVTWFCLLYPMILFLSRILWMSEPVFGGTLLRTLGLPEAVDFPLKRPIQPRLSAFATTSPTLASSSTTRGRRTPTTRH